MYMCIIKSYFIIIPNVILKKYNSELFMLLSK